jgi:hypothetical protein
VGRAFAKISGLPKAFSDSDESISFGLEEGNGFREDFMCGPL